MYFINEVYPSFRSTQEPETPLAKFLANNQIQLVKCETDLSKSRFFGNYLTSLTEQDAKLLSKLEKHSAVYIGSPKWPVYISRNTFAGNVGVFGGAISIDSPTFKNSAEYRLRLAKGRAKLLKLSEMLTADQSADLLAAGISTFLHEEKVAKISYILSKANHPLTAEQLKAMNDEAAKVKTIDYDNMFGMDKWNNVDNQPTITIVNNSFKQNQAYLSGNAIYARYTRQHFTSEIDPLVQVGAA